jgi:hypothetical protein
MKIRFSKVVDPELLYHGYECSYDALVDVGNGCRVKCRVMKRAGNPGKFYDYDIAICGDHRGTSLNIRKFFAQVTLENAKKVAIEMLQQKLRDLIDQKRQEATNIIQEVADLEQTMKELTEEMKPPTKRTYTKNGVFMK